MPVGRTVRFECSSVYCLCCAQVLISTVVVNSPHRTILDSLLVCYTEAIFSCCQFKFSRGVFSIETSRLFEPITNLVHLRADPFPIMSLLLDIFGITALVIVIIQILRSVIPWIYETYIGPALLGNRIKFKEVGEWAG